MLKVSKDAINGGMLVTLTGIVDEEAALDAQLGALSGNITIHCKGVERVNSVGTKAWIKYFQTAKNNCQTLTFTACSIAVVEQVGMISNFLCGGKVDSLYLPYLCEGCGHQCSQLSKADDLRRNDKKLPAVACPECGKPLIFDADPEDYLAFLDR